MAGARVAADLRGGGSMTASPVMRADLELSARHCRRPLVPVRRTWFLVGVVGEIRCAPPSAVIASACRTILRGRVVKRDAFGPMVVGSRRLPGIPTWP